MSTTTTPRTLSQRRSVHALQVIEAVKAANDNGSPRYLRPNAKQELVATEQGKKLGGQMKKLPTRIIAAGLGQALAFLRAKDEAPLLEHALATWLGGERTHQTNVPYTYPGDKAAHDAAKEFLGKLVNQWSPADLRRHTAEALAYLPWLVRFAEAEGLMEKEQQP